MGKVLTVSVAAFNVEEWIDKTLSSLVVEPIMKDLEVLIINDGSTDGTEVIAKKYVRRYPQTFRIISKKNGGYGSTINCSLKEAKGKYFKQLDGDDWFFSENLERFINLLKRVDADRIVTSVIRFNELTSNEEYADCMPDIKEGIYDIENIRFKDYLNMHSSTFSTVLLRTLPRKITENCFYTDLELTCYPVPYEKTYYISHLPIYVYRIGREGQSVSINSLCAHYKDHERVIKNLLRVYSYIDAGDKSRKKFLFIRLWMETLTHMKILCQIEDGRKGREELIRFVVSVKKRYPEIIKKCMDYSKFAKILIKSDFIVYKLFRYLLLNKKKINVFE